MSRFATAVLLSAALLATPLAAQDEPAAPESDLYVHVFDRLEALLRAIPERWETIPEPRVPYSGRRPSEVLATSTEEEDRTALHFISRLALSPLDARSEIVTAWLTEHEPKEIDLWLPMFLAQHQRLQSAQEEALTLEAWALWAETLGRKDALLWAASDMLDLIIKQRGILKVAPFSQTWVELPAPPEAAHGLAQITMSNASLLFLLGENDAALSAYRNARGLFQAVGSQLGQGNTWRGEADVLFLLGDNDAALSAYRNARGLFQAVGSQLGQGNTWLGEADVLLKSGEATDAAQAARRAADFSRGQSARWSELYAVLLEARAWLQLGETEQVRQLAEQAIGIFGEARKGAVTEAQRTGWESRINQAYDLLIPALWRLDQREEALERAEQARSRVLLDLVATRYAVSRREQEPAVGFDLRQQRLDLIARLAQIEKELEDDPPRHRQQELRQERAALDIEDERLSFEQLLSAGGGLESAPPLDIAGIRAAVAEVGPTLLYYVAAQETFVFLLQDGAEDVSAALDLSWGELRRRGREAAESFANPNYEERVEQEARLLWRDLVGPVADHLPAGGALTLILHGPLHQVPFEALIDPEGRSLGERFDIAVAPSISTLHHLRQNHHRPAQPDDRILALASGSGLSLPAAEIRKIAGFFDPQQAADFRPELARFSTYEKMANATRHLLIASQGVHTPGSRRDTYLEILPTDEHDSRLTAAEIANLPLDAELVTLAACDTAYAEALLSDERLDLTRAFLTAGAAAVLATRWKVPEDYRTSRFLVDFYRAYRQGGPDGKGMRKDQALSEARRRSRERGDPAQIWAAWVLVGDAR